MRVEGPAGTGKTLALLFKLHYMCEMHPGTQVLIVRDVRTALNSTIIPQYLRMIGRSHLCHTDAQPQSISQLRYPNGSVVVFGGMDNPGRWMGPDYDFIYINEGTVGIKRSQVDMLLTRFRGPTRSPYRQMIIDCNPSFPSHWLNTWAEDKENVRIRSQHMDNPIRFDWDAQEWTQAGLREIAVLETIGDEAIRERMLNGVWAAQEGAVFPLRRDVHAIHPGMWERGYPVQDCYAIVGLDWGIADPFSAHVYLVDVTQKAVYSVAERYAKNLTTVQMAREVVEMCNGFNVAALYYDEAMSARQSRGAETGQHGPPPILSFTKQFHESLGAHVPVIPGVKRPRLAGIDFVRGMMRAAIDQDRTKWALYIDPERCPRQWEEFEGAVWHKDMRDMYHEDIDPALPDHAITDCMYALRTHLQPGVGAERIVVPDDLGESGF